MSKGLLGGMSANLCMEAHLRELIVQGFEVTAVKDATAGPRHPDLGDGYLVALADYGFIPKRVITAAEAVKAMEG